MRGTVSRYSRRVGPSYQGMLALGVTTLSPSRAETGMVSTPERPRWAHECEEVAADGVEGGFGVADEVHLVDGGDDVRDAEEGGDVGVAAGLGEEAAGFGEGVGVDEDDGDVGGGGPGGHVAGVLLVAGRVGDDELAARGGEVAVGDVDGDSLLALGFEAVGEEGEVDVAVGGAVDAGALDGGELVFVDGLGVVEEAADEGGLAVVDGAGGGEAEHFLGEVGVEEVFKGAGGGGVGFGGDECGRTSEVALAFLHFHAAFFVVVDGAVFAFGAAEGDELFDDLGEGVGFGAHGAGAGGAAEGAHADLHHLRAARWGGA